MGKPGIIKISILEVLRMPKIQTRKINNKGGARGPLLGTPLMYNITISQFCCPGHEGVNISKCIQIKSNTLYTSTHPLEIKFYAFRSSILHEIPLKSILGDIFSVLGIKGLITKNAQGISPGTLLNP